MKKVLFIICLAIASCKNKNPQNELKEKCFPVVKKYVESLFGETPNFKIDSLIIVSVDTLTHADIEGVKMLAYDDEMKKIQTKFDEENETLKGYKRLCVISPNSEAAALMFNDQHDKTSRLQNGINYYDSLATLAAVNYQKAPKTRFFDYNVNFRLKYSNEKTEVQAAKDNASITLTPDFKVKEKSQFIDVLD